MLQSSGGVPDDAISSLPALSHTLQRLLEDGGSPIAHRQMRHACVLPLAASGAADLSSCGSMKPGLYFGVERRAHGAYGAVMLRKPSPVFWQLPAR